MTNKHNQGIQDAVFQRQDSPSVLHTTYSTPSGRASLNMDLVLCGLPEFVLAGGAISGPSTSGAKEAPASLCSLRTREVNVSASPIISPPGTPTGSEGNLSVQAGSLKNASPQNFTELTSQARTPMAHIIQHDVHIRQAVVVRSECKHEKPVVPVGLCICLVAIFNIVFLFALFYRSWHDTYIYQPFAWKGSSELFYR